MTTLTDKIDEKQNKKKSENKKPMKTLTRLAIVIIATTLVSIFIYLILENIGTRNKSLDPDNKTQFEKLSSQRSFNNMLNNSPQQNEAKKLELRFKEGYSQFQGLILFILIILILLYIIHVSFILRVYGRYRGKSRGQPFGDILSHFWYLLAIAIILPLFFSILPEIDFDFMEFNDKLPSILIHSFLSKIVTILMATELAVLFSNIEEKITEIAEDRLLTHLMVAIVIDIITLIVLYKIPKPDSKIGIAFNGPVKFAIIYTSSISFVSSYFSVFMITMKKWFQINNNESNDTANKQTTS